MNKDFYISLIARKLSKELNDAQLKDLSSWLESSKDNASLMDDFKSVWQMSGSYASAPAVSVDTAFDSFTERFNIPKADPAAAKALARKKSFTKLIYPIVAIIVLSIASILYFSSKASNNTVINENMHAMTVQIDPFSELTLAPQSKFKRGAGEAIAKEKINSYEELFTIVENSSPFQTEKSDYYEAATSIFEPESKNYIIEDFTGQGFFELKSINENQAFLGLGNGLSIGTRDAAFNLQNYRAEDMIIDVQKGTIVFYDDKSRAYIIHEGERAIYDKTARRLKRAYRSDVSPFKWHKGILLFDNTALPEVFDRIEKFYGVDVEVTDGSSTVGLSPFTSTLSMSSNLNDCLSLLQESYDMTIRRKGLRKIEISDISS